jgi:hypothetical protein
MQLPYICKCFICGRKYKSKSGLWRHQIKHKPIKELLQTRIEKEPVENSELLQTRIEKEPDKLVENTTVKTSTDPSTEQKRKKRIKRKKEKKQKTQKKIRMQSHGRTKKNLAKTNLHYKTANRVSQKCKNDAGPRGVRQYKGCDHV